jgi:hypothetical protein
MVRRMVPFLSPMPYTSIERSSPGKIDARDLIDLIAEVFLIYVEDLSPMIRLKLHHHIHGNGFCLDVGTKPPYFGGFPLGVGEHENARDPLDSLQAEWRLSLKFLASSVPPREELSMASFRSNVNPWDEERNSSDPSQILLPRHIVLPRE